MKYFIILFSILGLLRSCDEIVGPGNVQEYDNEIYRIVLDSQYTGNPTPITVILNDSTVNQIMSPDSYDNLVNHISGLEQETVENYRIKNETRVGLGSIPGVDYIIFKSQVEEKPEGSPDVTLSRIGYNYEKTQAILTYSEVWAPLAGHGLLFFLVRDNETWKISKTLMMWIS